MEPQSAPDERLPIVCKATGKLLARQTSRGLFLWCKLCKAWEFRSWAELMATEEKPAAS
jgi:hypothetical protein